MGVLGGEAGHGHPTVGKSVGPYQVPAPGRNYPSGPAGEPSRKEPTTLLTRRLSHHPGIQDVALSLGSYSGPRWEAFSHERGTPVHVILPGRPVQRRHTHWALGRRWCANVFMPYLSLMSNMTRLQVYLAHTKPHPPGPYSRTIPMALWGSWGGG